VFSVENSDYYNRIELLRLTGAKYKFLSLEPLLGPLADLNLTGSTGNVGGESGPHARIMDPKWAVDIRDMCLEQNVPFFFNSGVGTNKKKNGRLLEGQTWDQNARNKLCQLIN